MAAAQQSWPKEKNRRRLPISAATGADGVKVAKHWQRNDEARGWIQTKSNLSRKIQELMWNGNNAGANYAQSAVQYME